MFKKICFYLILLIGFAPNAVAQNIRQEIKIKTSAQCEMCKTRIENAMAYEKGVVVAHLSLDDKVVTITYKTNKTSPEKLRLALSKLGYDADEVAADRKAYNELPPCCKKPDDPDHIGH